jgi:hypothetical protein
MARLPEERPQDMRQAAIDLRDFIADMETAAFHAVPFLSLFFIRTTSQVFHTLLFVAFVREL